MTKITKKEALQIVKADGLDKLRSYKMHTSYDSLQAGLKERCREQNAEHGESLSYKLGALGSMVADLIEGSEWEKRHARMRLKKIIGRGRCLLNAADFNAGLKKGVST